MSPRPSMAAERRPQILAATARVIARRGFDETRLVDVAREAGVSVGSVQHYFGSRERLLMEAFVFVADRAVERWTRAVTSETDGWAQALALVDSVLMPSTFRERWTRWLEFWSHATRDRALRREMSIVWGHWRAPVRHAIETGIGSGAFRPRLAVEDIVDRTIATFDGLALQVLLDAPGMNIVRMREVLVAGLAADLGVEASRLSLAAAGSERR